MRPLPADERVIEDREEPRANVRAELILLPAIEGAEHGFRHEVFRFIALVRELERKTVERIEGA